MSGMQITHGGSSRHGIFLDAEILERQKEVEILRNEVKENRISFEFPDGFTDIPIIEDCRMLEDINNFDLMFDVTMQKLTGKPVIIRLKDDKGMNKVVASFVVTSRYMNLRGVDFIAEYPVVVTWLMEFMQQLLLKKYPLPPEDWSAEKEAKDSTK